MQVFKWVDIVRMTWVVKKKLNKKIETARHNAWRERKTG